MYVSRDVPDDDKIRWLRAKEREERKRGIPFNKKDK